MTIATLLFINNYKRDQIAKIQENTEPRKIRNGIVTYGRMQSQSCVHLPPLALMILLYHDVSPLLWYIFALTITLFQIGIVPLYTLHILLTMMLKSAQM